MTKRKKVKIGMIIRNFRVTAGLSQEEVAFRLGGKSGAYISLVESDKRYLSIEQLINFAEAMDITPGELLDTIAASRKKT